MHKVKREYPVTDAGQNLSDCSVSAFETNLNCDALLKSSEGYFLRAHQSILAKSPTLRKAMLSSDLRCLPEILLLFPAFKRNSISMFLQFLYTGEVDLVSGSPLLSEFQDLCRILKVNPKVYKEKQPVNTQEAESFTCEECHWTFNKSSKLAFHRKCCTGKANPPPKLPAANVTGVNNNTQKKDNQESATPNAQMVIQDDFHNESLNSSNSEIKEGEDQSVFQGGIGFKVPDNFDLPDEIIQEQLPAGRMSTSTPIRYSDEGPKDKKKEEKKKKKIEASTTLPLPSTSRQSSKEVKLTKASSEDTRVKGFTKSHHEVIKKKARVAHDVASATSASTLSKGRSVADELAAKRDRMAQKLRYDEDQNHHEAKIRDKKRKKVSPPLVEVYRKHKNSVHKKLKKHDKKLGKEHTCTSVCYDTTDEESDDEYNDREEEGEHKKAKRRRRTSSENSEDEIINKPSNSRSDRNPPINSQVFGGNALKVSFWNKGQDNFMELDVYRRTLLNTNRDERDDENVPKEKRLEKVGKRISQLVNSEDSESDDAFEKKTNTVKEETEAVQPKVQQPPPPPSMPKLPRIPKLQKSQ